MGTIDDLFRAIDANDRMAIERLLVQQPALQQGARRNGRTPLHAAVETGLASTVLALLPHSPELDARVEPGQGGADPKVGYTALHLAVARGNKQILELLLSAPRLDLSARTPQGETAAAMAERAMRPALAELIREREQRAGGRGASSPARR